LNVEGPESGPFVTNEARSKPSIARRFGGVAEWLGSGLQSRVQRFNSAPRLEDHASPTATPPGSQRTGLGYSQLSTGPLPGP
jgi:hypothetical protein